MLKLALNCLRQSINVYEGVSPSLLATMSLSANIKGSNMNELALSLQKAGLVSSEAELAAWKDVDRRLFTKSKNCYLNRPCPISKGENMTDIFTHAVIVNSLSQHWRENMRILDVGSGHGYLSFLIASILQKNKINNYKIRGIDIYEENIRKCHELQRQHFGGEDNVSFQVADLESFLERDQDRYDVVIGGFYLDDKMSDWLIGRLNEGGKGVWATRSEHGQALYKMQPNKEKSYLIQTLFSMPVVKTSVSKYFIEKNDEVEEDITSKTEETSVAFGKSQLIASIRKNYEQVKKNELKVLLEKHRSASGKMLSLAQMKAIPQIKAKLDELQQLPKMKIKLPK